MLFKKLFFIICFFIVAISNAQNKKTDGADTLSGGNTDVVVTGQSAPQSLKKSVYQVRVISKERIQQQGAVKLQDVLRNELNIRFSQDIALGGANISMMGMDGQNVKVLLDGIPITGRQGVSNEVDLNQIDVNTIERIEIVEGPMSVIYGADALAGVINIITKHNTTGTWTAQARAHEETIGKKYGVGDGIHNQTINTGWRNTHWEIAAGGAHNDFKGWQGDTTGRVLEWKPKEQWLGNAQARFTGKNWNLRYRIDALKEHIQADGNFLNNTASNQQYNTNRLMNQLQSDITVNPKLGIQAMASFTNFKRATVNTETDKLTGQEYYTTTQGDITKFTGASLRVTSIYQWKNWLALQAGIDANNETGEGGRVAAGTNKITDAGLFLAPEFKLANRIQLRPGLRFIYNSVYDAPPVVPSINTKITVSKKSDVRLAYARGFRAPSLRELYFYFFDANHQIIGNPDLQAELSHSFNGSYSLQLKDAGSIKWSLVGSGFFNVVSNLVGNAQSATNPQLTTYINIGKYKSTGGTLTSNFRWNNLQAAAGFGYTGRYNHYSEEDKTLPEFKWSPEATANVTYAFTKIGLDASLFFKYTGKLPRYLAVTTNNQSIITLTETDDYSWADFSLSKKLFKYITLQSGIRNLFNVVKVNSTAADGGIHSSGGGTTPIGYGRSYFLSLAFSINK